MNSAPYAGDLMPREAWEALEGSFKSIYAPLIDRETAKAPKKATKKKAA